MKSIFMSVKLTSSEFMMLGHANVPESMLFFADGMRPSWSSSESEQILKGIALIILMKFSCRKTLLSPQIKNPVDYF